MRDGKERIEALSEVDMQGDFLIRHKLGTKVLIDDYFFQFELFSSCTELQILNC